MNKLLFLAAALLGLGTAAIQSPTATQSTATNLRKRLRDLAKQEDGVKESLSQPKPAKPTSQPVAQRNVVVQPAPLAHLGFTSFIEKPHLRKVKYGKRRWVMV